MVFASGYLGSNEASTATVGLAGTGLCRCLRFRAKVWGFRHSAAGSQGLGFGVFGFRDSGLTGFINFGFML